MTSSAYFCGTVSEFLAVSRSELLATLTLRYAESGFAAMTSETPVAWWNDLEVLQSTLAAVSSKRPEAGAWGVALEFTIPRKLSRLDVVLLAGDGLVLLECKTGEAGSEAARQIESYALLLHYFHAASARRRIWPIVVSAREMLSSEREQQEFRARQEELQFEALPSFWIRPVRFCGWAELAAVLLDLQVGGKQSDVREWVAAPYRPTPTIIDAACELRGGLSIREVANSEAAEHDIAAVTAEIHRVVEQARAERRHAICFLTGVPGSGKTLVGLSLAHLSDRREDAIHFMSGNGPLVMVLQEVFRRQAMREGVASAAALVQAQTLIENVHVFAKHYTETDAERAPSNHVIIFDEAQRAWDRAQNLAKFKRDYSEPEMLLRIMERHSDWACVIALVGGGQEINSGEAGLAEWGRALSSSARRWQIHASPEVLAGGASTAGQRLFGSADLLPDGAAFTPEKMQVRTSELLHLRTSNRSLRADNLARWVNCVLEGDAEAAAALKLVSRFPIFLTRNLAVGREKLRAEALGESRLGLVGSSKAARLRAEGLEPDSTFHANYPWQHWYLATAEDVRSSYACEVFASEFEIQGLELDWIGLCWGGDLVWTGAEWQARKLWQGGVPRWTKIKSETEARFRRNAYRVLLTRARQGMVLFVPRGEARDPTRQPEEFDRTAEYLVQCGVTALKDVPPGELTATHGVLLG